MTSPVRLLYGFFCESLRQEVSGQTSAIGLWGGELRLSVPGPAVLPSIAFHAYFLNPDQVHIKGSLTLSLPGNPQPAVIPIDIPPVKGMSGANVNFGFSNIVIQNSSDIVANLRIDTEPPIEKEFRICIKFPPPSEGSLNIMIKCPKTGVPVRTGMGSNKISFDSSNFIGNMFRCPACGGIHKWDKKDAFLG